MRDTPAPGTSGMTVSDAGEATVIDTIRAAAPSTLNGDDAAVFAPSAPNSRHVCCTDILVQGRHFSFDYSTPREVGIKAVSQNFADIQAMGARPTACLLAIATPPDMLLSDIEQIAQGIDQATSPWAAELVGGDVVLSKDLVISLTALGELAGPAPSLNVGGAGVGQRVIAHGPIGYSAAGLALLEHYGSRANVPTDDPIVQQLVTWHCAPELSVGRGSVARAAGVNSMTDNSDGLIQDLGLIARRSGVRIDLDSAAIAPDATLQHAATITGADPWEWVLAGGEDHTLLGTTDSRIPSGYRHIGRVRSITDAGAGVSVDGDTPAYTQGWESL